MSRLLGQHRFVCRRDAARAERDRLLQHPAPEPLRRLGEPQGLAWNRSGDPPGFRIHALDGVAHGDRGDRRAGSGHRRQHPIDQRRIGERPRGIVNQHDIHIRSERRHSPRDRILPLRPARDHGNRASGRTDEAGAGCHQIFRQHDHDLPHGRMPVEGRDAALQHRAPAQVEQLLGRRRAHAVASPGRDDDRANHAPDSNVGRPFRAGATLPM